MEQELALYLQLLERRVEMLRDLCRALDQSQKAVAALDLDGIYQGNVQQETLCAAIRFLDRELQAAGQHARASIENSTGAEPAGWPNPVDPELARHFRSLGQQISELQEKVRHLNRVQDGLLRRSRRSVNMLLNLISNDSGTYQACGSHAGPAVHIVAGG